VAFHASNAQTILNALRLVEELELDAVLYGANEAWKVVDRIAAAGVPVVIGPVLSVPSSRFDPYDATYANAAVLARAGVPFAIGSGNDDNPRNLIFHAGFAAAFGLPRAEALRALTYYPAQILGVEDELGSIAPGRVADLVLTDGDLLEPTTAVVGLWIDGEPASLASRHTELYDRYRERMLAGEGK
jgi:imidazolonepropionase-like amidohydrolase